MRCHICEKYHIWRQCKQAQNENFFDIWVKQLEMHKTELSKDNKDGAYKGKVNHTDAKWETSDKVSTAWNS